MVSRDRSSSDSTLKLEPALNALLAYILCFVIISAFYVQFFWKEEPCPLCYLQRVGMIGVAFGALMNTKFGISRLHYGLSLIFALTGGAVALRQIALHVCPGMSVFGSPVFGLSLYTWSFLVFLCSVIYISLLFSFLPSKKGKLQETLFTKGAFWLTFLVVLINIGSTLTQCGLGPCE
jgi:disulfide bond formation protein DsbB